MATVISGTINSTGQVTSGSNFSCVYDNNQYVITYNPGLFTTPPVVMVTLDTSNLSTKPGAYVCSASVINASYTGCGINVQNLSGTIVQAGIYLMVSTAI
ncbi:MAG TPA: hypothetical protein VJ724_07845 [Tahibacter sp.]|nr:hypothetical protein [Tahibacter sp.]